MLCVSKPEHEVSVLHWRMRLSVCVGLRPWLYQQGCLCSTVSWMLPFSLAG